MHVMKIMKLCIEREIEIHAYFNVFYCIRIEDDIL